MSSDDDKQQSPHTQNQKKLNTLTAHWQGLENKNALYFGWLQGQCKCKNHSLKLDSKKSLQSSYQLTYVQHPPQMIPVNTPHVCDLQHMFDIKKRHSPFAKKSRDRSQSPQSPPPTLSPRMRMSSAEITKRLHNTSNTVAAAAAATPSNPVITSSSQTSALKIIRSPIFACTSYTSDYRPRTATTTSTRVKPILPVNQMPCVKDFPIPPSHISHSKSTQNNMFNELDKLKQIPTKNSSNNNNKTIKSSSISNSPTTDTTAPITNTTPTTNDPLVTLFKRKNDITQTGFVNFAEHSNLEITTLGSSPPRMIIQTTSYQSSHSHLQPHRISSSSPSRSSSPTQRQLDLAIRRFATTGILHSYDNTALKNTYQTTTNRFYSPQKLPDNSSQSPTAALTIDSKPKWNNNTSTTICSPQNNYPPAVPKKFYNYTVPNNHRDGAVYTFAPRPTSPKAIQTSSDAPTIAQCSESNNLIRQPTNS